MRFTTKTEYGLICLMYMARHRGNGVVTVPEIVQNERFSKAFIEKILQQLRKAKIVEAHHGIKGGYLLARDPAKITLREVVEALEGGTFDVFCKPDVREHIVCTHFALCGVKPVWQQTKEMLDRFFDTITLDRMAGNFAKHPATPGTKGAAAAEGRSAFGGSAA